MVLNLFRSISVLLVAGLVALSSTPGVAHKDHNKMVAAEEAANAQSSASRVNTPGRHSRHDGRPCRSDGEGEGEDLL